MRFKDIRGHEDIIGHLREMADSNRIPHALLLGGPAGVGKMQVARAFAQYIQCRNPHDGDSCGECPSCRQHEMLSNPDTYYVYPVIKRSSPTRNLSSDYIEEWKKMLSDSPYMRREYWLDLIDAGNSKPVIYVAEAAEISRTAIISSMASRYKIYIIWLPESMQPEAANKLLKLIEEPWENTLFILVSNDPGSLLPTIYSRTQRVNFRPLGSSVVEEYLVRERNIPSREASRVATLSEGSILRADELALDSEESREFGDLFRGIMRAAYSRRIAELLSTSETISSYGREKTMRFLNYVSRMVRENFIYNLGVPALNGMSDDEVSFSTRFAPFINVRNVTEISTETDRAIREIGRNANAKIVLFDYFLILCRLIRTS